VKDKAIKYVCSCFCNFYREDKEVLLCAAVRFLCENYTTSELSTVSEEYRVDYSYDRWILKKICLKCEFYPQDCGFRSLEDSPPCGGYILLEALRKKNP